jgi:hypothetical protein
MTGSQCAESDRGDYAERIAEEGAKPSPTRHAARTRAAGPDLGRSPATAPPSAPPDGCRLPPPRRESRSSPPVAIRACSRAPSESAGALWAGSSLGRAAAADGRSAGSRPEAASAASRRGVRAPTIKGRSTRTTTWSPSLTCSKRVIQKVGDPGSYAASAQPTHALPSTHTAPWPYALSTTMIWRRPCCLPASTHPGRPRSPRWHLRPTNGDGGGDHRARARCARLR